MELKEKIDQLIKRGMTMAQVAEYLNSRGIKTARGKRFTVVNINFIHKGYGKAAPVEPKKVMSSMKTLEALIVSHLEIELQTSLQKAEKIRSLLKKFDNRG
jgi:predicted mannosyl-3-phosphoglycerate phosphatase (HAD superfamily)